MKKIIIPILFVILVFCSCEQDIPVVTGSMTVNLTVAKFEMTFVDGGSFMMGAGDEQLPYAKSDELPAHQVQVSSYYICQTEITQAVWKAVMDTLPSAMLDEANNCPIGDNYPVTCVTYDDCLKFIEKLSSITKSHFALPTEAQWEFAAKGGRNCETYLFAGTNDVNSCAWCEVDKSHQVGMKKATSLSLYDISGNVAEWCYDWYSAYSDDSQVMPYGPEEGTRRVLRGGSYASNQKECRVTSRDSASPSFKSPEIGFRVILYNN